MVITDPEPYPVAYLKVEEVVLKEKMGWSKPTVAELRLMLGLDADTNGLDHTSHSLLESLRASAGGHPGNRVGFTRRGRWFAASTEGKSLPGKNVGQELGACFEALKSGHSLFSSLCSSQAN